jgi:hypothetical protein
MKKTILLLALLSFGCKDSEVREAELDPKLKACVVEALRLARQGYASNSVELTIIINSCEDNITWQKTPSGKRVLDAMKLINWESK